MRIKMFGHGISLTAFRSAAPMGVSVIQDIPKLSEQFWKYGVLNGDHSSVSESSFPNPMFAGSLEDPFTLHYGTDPLLGFHLATAYASLISGSPLDSSKVPHSSKVVAAAQFQFGKWCTAFRNHAQNNITIRFFIGDALAFCHTLQHKYATNDTSLANWYRDQSHLEPLILDGEDYLSKKNAPLVFNVIDSSNLLDHIGAINLMVAISPLLENSQHATLYTETLVKTQKDRRAFIDSFFCGHFPSISILFGLIPLEYWTNSTAISTVDENIIDTILNENGNAAISGQMQSRIVWKRLDTESDMVPILNLNAPELAHIMYQVYLKMFEHEDMARLLSKINTPSIQNLSLIHYNRGSMASFLSFIKKRVSVDWDSMIDIFLSLVESDTCLLMGRNYLQDFYLQLHLLGVFSASVYSPSFNNDGRLKSLKGLSAWKEVPSVVCITLKIPRAKLGVITKVPFQDLGTPILHCELQSSSQYRAQGWHNIFATIQLGFGTLSTSGSRYGPEFGVNIVEDTHGWHGQSPLIVSFLAPSWVLLLEPQGATIALGIQTTPLSLQTFMKVLGPSLIIHKTVLANEYDVYITKFRPNHSGHASVCGFNVHKSSTKQSNDQEYTTTIKASVDTRTGQMMTLIGRLDVISTSIKSRLSNGAVVETHQISPCIVKITIGKNDQGFNILFPTPVLQIRSKSRIARKSSYIEIEVPMADHRDGNGIPNFIYPMFPNMNGPEIWNIPRLNTDCLPIINTFKKKNLGWLNPHTSLMLSSRERYIRDKSVKSGATYHGDVRIDFKDSLFTMFMRFSGLQGESVRYYGIDDPENGGMHILIFVSSLRLDIANHTPVLDVAIVPLYTSLLYKISDFLQRLTQRGICAIKVNSEELRLWKEILPAWIERCRDWEHRPSCEYVKKSKIPLSLGFGQNPICSCSEGTLPPNLTFDIPGWNLVAKYAARAVISPVFSVAFVEQSFKGTLVEKRNTTMSSTAKDLGGNEPKMKTLRQDDDSPKCQTCNKTKPDQPGKGLLKCGRCQNVRYCSVECQRSDWKEHKKACT